MVDKCNRCGFCQAGCPTYKTHGLEWQVSRGRVALVRDILDGRIELNEDDVQRGAGDLPSLRGCTIHCPPQVPTARDGRSGHRGADPSQGRVLGEASDLPATCSPARGC